MVHVVDESDWRWALPSLEGDSVGLRELRLSDASALLDLLTDPAVAAHVSTPQHAKPEKPARVEGPGLGGRPRREETLCMTSTGRSLWASNLRQLPV